MPACPRSDSPTLSSSLRCANVTAPTALADADIRNFAPVARIMKTALPENAKIAKEAKECMQECVSEFISFITSEGTLFIYFFPRSPLLDSAFSAESRFIGWKNLYFARECVSLYSHHLRISGAGGF